MNTEFLEQLSYLAEIISGVVVVISLIYVGIQIKQNTQAIRNSTLHNIAETQINVHALLAANGDLANIVFEAATGKDFSQGVDKFRFTSWMHTAMRCFENAYYQHKAGALDERNWMAMCRQYGPILHAGFNKQYWEERGFMFGEDFRNFIDSEIMKKPMPSDWSVPGQDLRTGRS